MNTALSAQRSARSAAQPGARRGRAARAFTPCCVASTSQQAQPSGRGVPCSTAPSTSSHSPALRLAAGVAAAAIVTLSTAGSSLAVPAYSELPGFGAGTPFSQAVAAFSAGQPQGPSLDDLYDENLMTAELKDFVNRVLNNKLKANEYPEARLKMGFKRDVDGRVSLRARDGKWYRVKNDMEAPGFLLLQDNLGYVYYLPPDDDGIEQVDLSDDVVVAQLFSSTAWQDVMAPVAVLAEGADAASAEAADAAPRLQMSDAQFRGVVSLLAEAVEAPEEEEAPETAAIAPQ